MRHVCDFAEPDVLRCAQGAWLRTLTDLTVSRLNLGAKSRVARTNVLSKVLSHHCYDTYNVTSGS